MTPVIFVIIVIALVVLDLVLDLQLFAMSIALSFLIVGLLHWIEVSLAPWQWAATFTFLTGVFVIITRQLIKKNDNEDINKY